MNCVTPVLATPLVRVQQFHHAAGVAHVDPERESASAWGVHLVDQGTFALRTSGPWMTMSSEHVFVTSPGLEFSCAHTCECPDDRCTSVVFSDEAVESARAETTLSRAPRRHLTNRQAYLRAGVTAADGMQAESAALALLATLADTRPPRRLYRQSQLTFYAARIDRAQAHMRSHFADPLTLSMLARDCGMSVFHFARLFTELAGVPPHKFLLQVRLGHALAMLAQGASVTDTSLACGFGSLSHFVTSVKRRYGVTPSQLRGSKRAIHHEGNEGP